MRPVDEIGGDGVRPLMPAQATERGVMIFILQVEKVKHAVMEERHTVPREELITGRLKVLHWFLLNREEIRQILVIIVTLPSS